MKLVYRLLVMGFQKNYAARLAMVLYIIISVWQTLLGVGVWMVARVGHLKTDVSDSTLLTYFVLITLFQAFVWSGISRRVGKQDIRMGALSVWLLKPVPYYLGIFLEEVSWRVLRSLITVPVFLLLFFLFRSQMAVSWQWFAVSLLFFPLGYLLIFLVQFLVGVSAFWLGNVDELSEVAEILMIFFSGVGIPLFFLPPALQTVSAWTPFSYALYTPTLVAMGQLTVGEIFRYLVISLIWIVMLGVIAARAWKLGLRRYGAEGT